MQQKGRCEPISLAQHGCCEIQLCPQCDAIHLHIGPVSLKLPPDAFRQACTAMADAAVELQEQYPDAHKPEPARPSGLQVKH